MKNTTENKILRTPGNLWMILSQRRKIWFTYLDYFGTDLTRSVWWQRQMGLIMQGLKFDEFCEEEVPESYTWWWRKHLEPHNHTMSCLLLSVIHLYHDKISIWLYHMIFFGCMGSMISFLLQAVLIHPPPSINMKKRVKGNIHVDMLFLFK